MIEANLKKSFRGQSESAPFALNVHLVRGIDSNGPRQAIVRGVFQTCSDLGIDEC